MSWKNPIYLNGQDTYRDDEVEHMSCGMWHKTLRMRHARKHGRLFDGPATAPEPAVERHAEALMANVPDLYGRADALEVAQAFADMVEEEEADAACAVDQQGHDPAWDAWLDAAEAVAAMQRHADPHPLPAHGIAHAACGIDPMATWPEQGPQDSTEDFTPSQEGF